MNEAKNNNLYPAYILKKIILGKAIYVIHYSNN